MKITEYTIHEAELKNNCPECYSNDGLILSFTQKEKENAWLRKAEKDLEVILFCNTCETRIFPVRWDEHIERVYDYYQKLVTPRSTRTHYKKRFWLTLSIGLVVITGALAWFGYNMMS